MKYDIAALLSTIFNDAGMSEIMEGELSNHSTISLTMKDDIPTIHLKTEDDEVWIWAKIVEQAPDSLDYCSSSLLNLLLDHDEEYFYTGQPCIYPISGDIELRAQIKDKFLQDPEDFLSMLDKFLALLQEYRAVII
jgi:type III secretion system chaperone